MCQANNEKQKTINDGKNRITKSSDNQQKKKKKKKKNVPNSGLGGLYRPQSKIKRKRKER